MSGKDLLKELTSRRNYSAVFASLRVKAEDNPTLLQRAPICKDLSLRWVLMAEERVTRFLIAALKARKYRSSTAYLSVIMRDKERRIFALPWPDRIFDATVAHVLSRSLEPHLSSRLFSYRPGTHCYQPVSEFAAVCAEYANQHRPLYVAKRDLAKYYETIQVPKLLEILESEFGPQDPYFRDLLTKLLQPLYRQGFSPETKELDLGVPTGYCTANVCANLYAHRLDREVGEKVPGLFYCRYCDDLLMAHTSAESLQGALKLLTNECAALGLKANDKKSRNVVFQAQTNPTEPFQSAEAIELLGYRVNARGEIFLSTRRVNKIKKEVRGLCRRAVSSARRMGATREEQIESSLNTINLFLNDSLLSSDLRALFTGATDQSRLKALDRWIAKQALRHVYGTGHDRLFRYVSFESLRSRGLLSLVNLRNVWRRQHVSSGA